MTHVSKDLDAGERRHQDGVEGHRPNPARRMLLFGAAIAAASQCSLASPQRSVALALTKGSTSGRNQKAELAASLLGKGLFDDVIAGFSVIRFFEAASFEDRAEIGQHRRAAAQHEAIACRVDRRQA
jgi:hypothetical protein